MPIKQLVRPVPNERPGAQQRVCGEPRAVHHSGKAGVCCPLPLPRGRAGDPQTPGSPEDPGDPRAASLLGSGPPPACCPPTAVWACPKRATSPHGDQGKVCQITGCLAGAQWLVLCCLGGNRALPKSSFLSGTSVNARLHGDESFQVRISGPAMSTGPNPSLPGSQ